MQAHDDRSRNCLVSEKVLARILGVSHRTLQKFRARGIGPHYYKLGRSVKYSLQDAELWKQSCAVRRNG